MSKILIVRNCYQCYYSEKEREKCSAWCYVENRKIQDFPIIPEWCPLPDREEDDEKRN